MNKLLVFISLIFTASFSFAADDNLINGLKGSEITTSGEQIILTDMWYQDYLEGTTSNYFTLEKSEVRVKLWFDDALKTAYSSPWELSITYDLLLTRTDGTEAIFDDQALEIDYNNNGTYTDIALAVFNADDYIKASLSNVVVVSNTHPNGASLANDIHLDMELRARRYYNLDDDEYPTLVYNTDLIDSKNELELVWSYIEGAESYDVEWLFIDIPDVSGTPPISSWDSYDFKNATRINCLNNHYRISMAYPRGLFLFRVRAVGKEFTGGQLKRIEGSWSLAANGDPTTLDASVKYEWNGLKYVTDSEIIDLNWQYQATYAEEGKRGEVFSVYDGGFKARQSVAINNSDNTAIVSDQVYDFLGRPALTLLPTPVENEGIGFYPDRLLSGSDYTEHTNYYDYHDFDVDTKVLTPDDMASLGANTYYKDDGSAIGFNSDYVADAKDYPFARTLFMNDGTGRVKMHSAPGSSAIGSNDLSLNKNAKYIYGTPTQEELYRLFGNEVGDASHYKKNAVIDQNGQAHLQYVDLSGRVIATYLGGDAPQNLETIDSYPETIETITADLTLNNELNADNQLVVSKKIVVPFTTDYEFTYSLADISMLSSCLPGTHYVEYDVLIYIEDEEGNRIPQDYNEDATIDADETELILTGITAQSAIEWTASLELGSYTITKVLSLNAEHVLSLATSYDASQTCYTVDNTVGSPCNPTCEELCFSAYGYINDAGNKVYHNTAGDPIAEETGPGTYAMFKDENGDFYDEVTDLGPILTAIEDCEELCDADPKIENTGCENIRNLMIADMSPGGQYFDNIPYGSDASPSNDWLTGITGPGAAGLSDLGEANWDDVRTNWEEADGEILFEYHPEYCLYAYYCARDNGGFQGTYEDSYITPGVVVSVPTCPIGTITEDEYTTLMYSTSNPDADGLDYLFNPVNTAYTTSTTPPNAYQPNATVSVSELDPFVACRDDDYDYLKNYIEEELLNFMSFEATSGTITYSLWYVIDNPDEFYDAADFPAGTPDYIVDYFNFLHGTDNTDAGDFIGENADQVTEYEFFRSTYLALRKKADYNAISNFTDIDVPTACDGEAPLSHIASPYGNGLDENHFVIRYPAIPTIEDYGSEDAVDDNGDYITDDIDNLCGLQCEETADVWISQLDGCCTNPAHLDAIRSYFIDICSASCDVENPFGTDDMSPSTVPTSYEGWGTSFSTFEDVINHHNTVHSPSDCEAPVHPIPTPEEMAENCDCENVTSYVKTFYLNNGVSIPSSYNLTLQLTTDQLDDLEEQIEDMLTEDEETAIPAVDPEIADIQSWLTDCENGDPFSTTLIKTFICGDAPEPDLSTWDADCGDAYDDLANFYVGLEVAEDIEEGWLGFFAEYLETSWQNIESREVFTMAFDLNEYHYTLFYYDQAGNLIKTVPPAGIYRKDAAGVTTHSATLTASEIQDCKDHIADPETEPYIHPGVVNPATLSDEQEMITNYRYNSLQQLIQQTTPDGGTTNFWYDELGRLIVSQNARQAAVVDDEVYSYTIYDELGRIIEVGEIASPDEMTDLIATNASQYYTWLTTSTVKTEVVRTLYEAYAEDVVSQEISNEFDNDELYSLRGRIGSVMYNEILNPLDGIDDFDNALHYSYDYAGNVKSMISEYADIATDFPGATPMENMHLVKIDYEYDLISGNVIQVDYQDGKKDQYHHRYEYDANNRLTDAYSSKDGEVWEKESKTFYYAHGPMARTEIGDQVVQAKDYVYTLNGWLKTVNSSINHEDRDAGRDSKVNTLNEFAGKDAFAFSLHYFNGDYDAVNTASTTSLIAGISGSDYGDLNDDLYNGNISRAITSLNDELGAGQDVLANLYRYDQLQRIKSSHVFEPSSTDAIRTANAVTDVTANDNGAWQTDYIYDGNGNLLDLERKNETGLNFDNLVYDYKTDAGGKQLNQLSRVYDYNLIPGAAVGDLESGQLLDNYDYDEIGQLIKDDAEGITGIDWTVGGKVKKITYDLGPPAPSVVNYVEFDYDALGNRISKTVAEEVSTGPSTSKQTITKTYYMHDASGNVMATYRHFVDDVAGEEVFVLKENHVYGSARLGVDDRGSIDMEIAASSTNNYERTLGNKFYELSNHRGDVLAVVSDKKNAVDAASDGTVDYYDAEIEQYQQYFPFGMTLNGKSFTAESYRYGFQGQEMDDEIKGEGNSVNYKYRMHDPRIGRFFAVDPLAPKYPHNSPYAFSENRVIDGVELEGLEWESATAQMLVGESLDADERVSLAIGGAVGLAALVGIIIAPEAVTALVNYYLTNPNAWITTQELILGLGGYDGISPAGTGVKGMKALKNSVSSSWDNFVKLVDEGADDVVTKGAFGKFSGHLFELKLAQSLDNVVEVGREFSYSVLQSDRHGNFVTKIWSGEVDLVIKRGSKEFFGEIKTKDFSNTSWKQFKKKYGTQMNKLQTYATNEFVRTGNYVGLEYYFGKGVSQEIVNELNNLGIKSYDATGTLIEAAGIPGTP